jgi:ATP-binding cassette subfamily B multidrug efflux pump
MDKGRIVEEGDHKSLLARRGLYARLWEHQSGGFLGDESEDDEYDETSAASRYHASDMERAS